MSMLLPADSATPELARSPEIPGPAAPPPATPAALDTGQRRDTLDSAARQFVAGLAKPADAATAADPPQAHSAPAMAIAADSIERFGFGENWRRFLSLLDERRICDAIDSLRAYLGVNDLHGKSFLDIGSGSGLFSLAARRMGATVHSIDYDLDSVACTRSLRDHFYPGDANWQVAQGSVLDPATLPAGRAWDVVYSWGVLHHTGHLWAASQNCSALVAPGGQLFISIYNDQGVRSRLWLMAKQAYNTLPAALRWLVLWPSTAVLWGPRMVIDALRGQPMKTWREYSLKGQRGMSAWYDVVDWVGGLPFEVAKPEEVLDFHRARGFELHRMTTCGGSLGCNQFVFQRQS